MDVRENENMNLPSSGRLVTDDDIIIVAGKRGHGPA